MADATAWISGAIHATASDWAARVVTNGGAAVSDNTLAAVSNFCGALDAAAIRSLIFAANIFAPDNLIASTTPLIVDAGIDPWTNTNFVASDLTIQGLRGNGTSKYLDTGIPMNSLWAANTDGGLSAYNTFADLHATVDIGGGTPGTPSYIALSVSSGANAVFDCFGAGAGRLSIATTLPYGLGFTSGNRNLVDGAVLYVANSTTAFASLGTIATTQGSNSSTRTLYVLGYNNNGTAAWSWKRLSFAAIHHGFTSAQCQNLYNAVQQMRQAMGGGWV